MSGLATVRLFSARYAKSYLEVIYQKRLNKYMNKLKLEFKTVYFCVFSAPSLTLSDGWLEMMG